MCQCMGDVPPTYAALIANDEVHKVNTLSRLTDVANSQPCVDLLFINYREVDLAWSQDRELRDMMN